MVSPRQLRSIRSGAFCAAFRPRDRRPPAPSGWKSRHRKRPDLRRSMSPPGHRRTGSNRFGSWTDCAPRGTPPVFTRSARTAARRAREGRAEQTIRNAFRRVAIPLAFARGPSLVRIRLTGSVPRFAHPLHPSSLASLRRRAATSSGLGRPTGNLAAPRPNVRDAYDRLLPTHTSNTSTRVPSVPIAASLRPSRSGNHALHGARSASASLPCATAGRYPSRDEPIGRASDAPSPRPGNRASARPPEPRSRATRSGSAKVASAALPVKSARPSRPRSSSLDGRPLGPSPLLVALPPRTRLTTSSRERSCDSSPGSRPPRRP